MHAACPWHSWLAMSANVSVGYTPQTTDIFVCHRHVGNVVPTRRRHSVMSANFSAVGVMSVRPIADTHSYMYVGIGTNEVVTTYEDMKIWNVYRLIYSLSDFAALKNKARTYSLRSTKDRISPRGCVETGNIFGLVM